MKKLFLAALAITLAGCASLRKPDETTSNQRLRAIAGAASLKEAVNGIDSLAEDYVGQKQKLETDIITGGDAVTIGGIGAGVAAVAKASADVFKAIGVGVGVLGVYNVRYNPTQQRQHYAAALDSLGCISNRALRLQREEDALRAMIAHSDFQASNSLRAFASTSTQTKAAQSYVDRIEATHREVVKLHRRLEDKLFATVSTQTVSSIRDDLIKQSIDANERAKEVASTPPAAPGVLMAAVGKAGVREQIQRLLADATTYETDIAACTESFLK